MTRRLLLSLIGITFLAIVLGGMLLTNVPADRGRNELDYLTIHELPLSYGAELNQPIELQRADPYAIKLPYHWQGRNPARIQALIIGPDGGTLYQQTERLPSTESPNLLEPTSDGSVWQHLGAAMTTLRVPQNASPQLTLRLTRIDHEPDPLILYASLKQPPPRGQPALSIDNRPGLVEKPAEVLEFESEYGVPRPAYQKIPTYLARMQSLAPPWLPFPMPEVLFLFMVVSAGALYWHSFRL